MSPQRRDPAIRALLIDAAARILAEGGTAALTTRRLAAETSRSTMAIYTHLGGMERVQHAVRVDGFARLAAAVNAVSCSPDPVADLARVSDVYFSFGLSQPHLYRAMFIDRPVQDDDAGTAAFDRIVKAVRRCIDGQRLPSIEPAMVLMWAAQLWSMRHGIVTMVLSGALPEPQARHVLSDMTLRLLIGYGDDPAAARRSLRHALTPPGAPE
ncbi:TetR/AcrR family transcriptional regulator [Streptomyces sp. SID14478]|uniref:WHG domain-containing protein n=1 Tax=Streptomyces sp. SID14478 TaxID=2706073 RepID=UPI0013D90475|nr:TetR/AcrR family transcriptional regulator [Streptomyces sp. SID14478]